jgi:chlorobactene glucosyltransferase
MILEILAYIAFGFLLIRIAVTLSNLLSDNVLKRRKVKGMPLISILIPARNEGEALPELLKGLASLDYPQYEVIIYDDASEDETSTILQEANRKYGWLNYIRGKGPEEGWLGKNFACHQLAMNAKGEYMLFLDADVSIEPSLLLDVITTMLDKKVKLLSVFPKQEMYRPGEWLTVPVMNQILVSLLPLYLVRNSSWKDFAAANGQLMLFEKENYMKHEYHKLFKADPVEDIRIMRDMKRLGYPVLTCLSDGQVSCRMYHSFSQAVLGFSKNVIQFFGGRLGLILLYLFLTNFGFLFVLFGLPLFSFITYLLLTVLLKGMTSWVSRQKVIPNVLLLPLQQASLNVIVFSAIYHRLKRRMEWKGRSIKLGS